MPDFGILHLDIIMSADPKKMNAIRAVVERFPEVILEDEKNDLHYDRHQDFHECAWERHCATVDKLIGEEISKMLQDGQPLCLPLSDPMLSQLLAAVEERLLSKSRGTVQFTMSDLHALLFELRTQERLDLAEQQVSAFAPLHRAFNQTCIYAAHPLPGAVDDVMRFAFEEFYNDLDVPLREQLRVLLDEFKAGRR